MGEALNQLIVSISGVRGIVGSGLTPEVALRFSAAFAKFCNGGKVVVGRDSRTSGEMLGLAVISGLPSVGSDVIDLGICPTPTVQLAVEDEKAGGGIVITASHNPAEWNGLKFIGPDGIFLDDEEGGRLLRIFRSGEIGRAGWDSLGRVMAKRDSVERHVERICALDLVSVDLIRSRKFKVVLDPCNGAGGVIGPSLLRSLGCNVIELNCKPTGIFAHAPEPIPENLGELCKAVRQHDADVGFATDPDADRLAIVSDSGEAIGEEYSLALVAKLVLSKRKGPVVTNLSTSRMLDDIAEEIGVEVIRTPVGEVNVAKKMREVGATVGGEGSGGVILPELHLGRDAPVGMALILEYLAETGRTLSDLVSSIPGYTIVKRKFERPGLDKAGALRMIEEGYGGQRIDTTDGVKIIIERSWIHVRPSNTEPIIRVIAEAEDRKTAEAMCDEVLKKLEESTG